MLITSTALPTGAIAAASADQCPDIQVVFARGTGEPPGVGRVGQAFVDALQPLVGRKSVAVYGVNYPASDDFLQAVAGADDASAFIQNVATTCPHTSFVLGGYSQGAAITDLVTAAGPPKFGFADPMPDDVAPRVAAVAVFGNPSDRVAGLLSPLALYADKTIDLCNGGDPVCSAGGDVSAHSRYVQAGLPTQAADFVAKRLSASGRTVQDTAAGGAG